MYAHSHQIIKDKIIVPVFDIDFALPETLSLKFADQNNLVNIQDFLEEGDQNIGDWLYALNKGRLVCLLNPLTHDIYGVCYAEKQNTGHDRHTILRYAQSKLPWIALDQMMAAAVYLNENIRDIGTKIYNHHNLSNPFHCVEDAENYLQRACYIKSVTCGSYQMKLDLAEALGDIAYLKKIRGTVRDRCGS